MRVIAGMLKGRRLEAPTWDGLRPTSDKLRETLFNVLAPRIVGARVVDGFAGTGAIGIEALSRGAEMVAFIERDAKAVELIEANLAHCQVEKGYAITRASFERGVKTLRLLPSFAPFDIVFLDPPYRQEKDDVEDVLESASTLLADEGVVVLEHAKRRMTPEGVGGLARTRQIVSGDSVLSFYARLATHD